MNIRYDKLDAAADTVMHRLYNLVNGAELGVTLGEHSREATEEGGSNAVGMPLQTR